MVTSSAWGFDLSMTNSLQSVDQFMNNFGNPTGAKLGFYGAASSVAGMVATIVAGPLVDRLGRRALCFAGSAIVIAMAIMQIFAPSFPVFTVAGPMLVMELVHPKSREAISSLYNTSIYIGLISGAWISFGTFRKESACIWFCPESPRWLVSRGRLEEARANMIKYHGNGQETEIVRYELQEIVAGIKSDKTQIQFNAEGLPAGSQCAGSSLISAYLPQILDQVGFGTAKDKTLINEAGVTAALFAPHIRRRMLFLWSTTGTLITFIIWMTLSARYIETSEQGMGIGIVTMVFLYNIIYCTCWLPLVITYPLETVTTKQRGLFFSWTVFCINGSSLATTGLTLEEVAVVFDDEPEVRQLERETEKEKEDGFGVQVEDVKDRV
ncbi:major facilitator superfamily domain-containing protein [Aspergillus spectabilis]